MQPARPHDYFGLTVPFLDHIGLEPVHFGEGKAGTRLPLRHPITNSRGEVQGGGLMTALDFTMSAAARAAFAEPMAAATVDMNTTFLAPAVSDMAIEARVVKAGRTLVFCEGEIRDPRGELVARATGTFRVFARGGARPGEAR